MTINKLSSFLRKRVPQAYSLLPAPELAGYRVAVDAFDWMYTNMGVARRLVIEETNLLVEKEPDPVQINKQWFQMLINFVERLLGYGITPLFVFDGPCPLQKGPTRQKRREQREKTLSQIEDLRSGLDSMPLSQTETVLKDLRKAMRSYNVVSTDNIEMCKQILSGIGIPVLQCKEEGEKLCSMLCLEGKVKGVYSSDSDNIAYACPLLLTGFSKEYLISTDGQRVHQFETVRFEPILSALSLSYLSFLDLCIMCGCDFNTNIKGIGPERSYKLMLQHGSIEDLPPTLCCDCLLYQDCRKLFARQSSSSLIEGEEPALEIKSQPYMRECLEQICCGSHVYSLMTFYSSLPPPRDWSAPIKSSRLRVLL